MKYGLKYGFDFALYDAASANSKHAPLGVLVLTARAEGERSWLWLQRHVRVCHTVGKGLLLCTVGPPAVCSVDATSVDGDSYVGVPPPLDVSTMRVDGWDPGREHALLST